MTAIEALRNNQRQLDQDGVEVGVSRQALDEVLARFEELERKLFPYADENPICGMGWNDFYLIGNKKSIDELRRIENNAAQIEVYRTAFLERKAVLEAELSVFREAAQEFCKRVEAGEVRSKLTYAKFKTALEAAPGAKP